MNAKDRGSRLFRWRIKLEEYDYEIVYKQEHKIQMRIQYLELVHMLVKVMILMK